MKIKELLQKKWFQLTSCLLLGVTIGVVFYPTKTIEERLRQEIMVEADRKVTAIKEEKFKDEMNFLSQIAELEKSYKELHESTKISIEQLQTENRELKQSSKKQKFKLIKPDGTIVEKEYEESNTEETTRIVTEIRQEFDRKVKSIEEKWKETHEERLLVIKSDYESRISILEEEHRKEIARLERDKKTEINAKKLRPEVGITTDKEVYLHTTYDLWGPLFIGGGVTGTKESLDHFSLGLGISL